VPEQGARSPTSPLIFSTRRLQTCPPIWTKNRTAAGQRVIAYTSGLLYLGTVCVFPALQDGLLGIPSEGFVAIPEGIQLEVGSLFKIE
jgi:hypothetical protein